jgi:hypothetical protein
MLVDYEENLIACFVEAAAITGQKHDTFLSPHDNPSFIIVSFVLR